MNMKKIVAILSGIILMGLNVMGQEKSFKIGIKVSPNVSWLKTENGDITLDKAPLKFGYGLVFDKMFAENYAIGTGVNVYNMGGMASFTYGNKVADTTYLTQLTRTHKLSYVEVPLTLKLRTSPIAGMTYWGQFGVGVGYLFKAFGDDYSREISNNRSGGVYSDVTSSNDLVEDLGNEIQDQMNPIRASMIVAAGIEYPISGSTFLMGGITYNGGILSAYKMGDEVAKLTNGSPVFATDKMSFEKTTKKMVANMIELNIGIIF